MALLPDKLTTITVHVRLPWWWKLYLWSVYLRARLNEMARRHVTIDCNAIGERIARHARYYTMDSRGRKRWWR